ncbi:MAG: ATP-binding protein, partial [Magnetococcales bacterium]|nr:ATP-binding protein [Magnetococcales bacterium]
MWGGSSSGKTYSALRLARGLVGPQGKIGVIDTENRRALFYAG